MKAFILSICGAVVFTTLLVCANAMAMSIPECTREVAVLRTLGFTRPSIVSRMARAPSPAKQHKIGGTASPGLVALS